MYLYLRKIEKENGHPNNNNNNNNNNSSMVWASPPTKMRVFPLFLAFAHSPKKKKLFALVLGTAL